MGPGEWAGLSSPEKICTLACRFTPPEAPTDCRTNSVWPIKPVHAWPGVQLMFDYHFVYRHWVIDGAGLNNSWWNRTQLKSEFKQHILDLESVRQRNLCPSKASPSTPISPCPNSHPSPPPRVSFHTAPLSSSLNPQLFGSLHSHPSSACGPRTPPVPYPSTWAADPPLPLGQPSRVSAHTCDYQLSDRPSMAPVLVPADVRHAEL